MLYILVSLIMLDVLNGCSLAVVNLIKLLSIAHRLRRLPDIILDAGHETIFQQIMHRNKYKTNKLIGSFKLDVATVWYQKGNRKSFHIK